MTSELPFTPGEVAALFLKELPFIALPGPPRWVALPAPKGYTAARVTSVSMRAAAPAPAAPPPAAPAPTTTPVTATTSAPRVVAPPPDVDFPTPPPLTGFQTFPDDQPEVDENGLEPSPWDPGFDPPKTAVGTDPTALGPDPRVLSLNRPKRSATIPKMRAASAPPPPVPKKAGPPEQPTHDFVIIPQNPTFRTAEQGVNAVLTYLRTAQFFSYRARRDLPDETVFELAPEAFVHQIFGEGAAPPGPPSALEATLRVSKAPRPAPFGPAGRTACFFLTLVGCRYPKIGEPFKARLQQIIYLRPEIYGLPHDPARLRAINADAPAPIPAFDVQEVDRS